MQNLVALESEWIGIMKIPQKVFPVNWLFSDDDIQGDWLHQRTCSDSDLLSSHGSKTAQQLIDMILQMYSTCLTCITAGIRHMEALSQNQQHQQHLVAVCHITSCGRITPMFPKKSFKNMLLIVCFVSRNILRQRQRMWEAAPAPLQVLVVT